MSKITEALKKAEQERQAQGATKEKAHKFSFPWEVKDSGELKIGDEVILYHQPKSYIAEQYRILRTNILSLNSQTPPRSFVVTSSMRGEGKTVTSLNLAIALSSDPHKSILLVDCDLRKPGLNKLLGLNSETGLAEILDGTASLEEVVLRIGSSNLFFLSSGKTREHPTEILDSWKMRELIKKMRSQFNYIILDTPPVISFTDAGILGSKVDGVLFVIQAGRTQKRTAERAQGLLRQARARLLGVILTGLENYIPQYIARYYRHYNYYYGMGAEEG